MLEHGVLVIRPRTASGVRLIVDGESGAPLGYERWERGTPRWWRCWLARSVQTVREQEDEPLLFTIRRIWGLPPRREVRDAEGQIVGSCSLSGRMIHDQFGRPSAAFREADATYRGRSQAVLAELTATAEGLRIAFRHEIAGEPFVKMLLLAAALMGEPPQASGVA